MCLFWGEQKGRASSLSCAVPDPISGRVVGCSGLSAIPVADALSKRDEDTLGGHRDTSGEPFECQDTAQSSFPSVVSDFGVHTGPVPFLSYQANLVPNWQPETAVVLRSDQNPDFAWPIFGRLSYQYPPNDCSWISKLKAMRLPTGFVRWSTLACLEPTRLVPGREQARHSPCLLPRLHFLAISLKPVHPASAKSVT